MNVRVAVGLDQAMCAQVLSGFVPTVEASDR